MKKTAVPAHGATPKADEPGAAESVRTDPRNHAAEGDERIRTAVGRYSVIKRFESSPPTTVYFIQDELGPIKIGHASDIVSRLRTMQAGNPRHLTVLAYFTAPRAFERHLHDVLFDHRVRGEWFQDHADVREALRLSLEMWGNPDCDECDRAERYLDAGYSEPPPPATAHVCAPAIAGGNRA